MEGVLRDTRPQLHCNLQECPVEVEKCKNSITRKVGARDRARGGGRGKEAAPQEAAEGDRERDLKARKRGENRVIGWLGCL